MVPASTNSSWHDLGSNVDIAVIHAILDGQPEEVSEGEHNDTSEESVCDEKMKMLQEKYDTSKMFTLQELSEIYFWLWKLGGYI